LGERPRWSEHLVVLGLYLALTVLLTYPLILHFNTHVPGDGSDDPALVWNLWWVKYAVVDLQSNPLLCDYMFYPLGIDLTFYTLTILNGFSSVPLLPLLGLVTTSNLIFFSTFVLSAYGAYLLVKYLLPREAHAAVPFLAGLIYAFSSNRLVYASLGQFNILSTQWIPFYVLFLIKSRRQAKSLRYPLLATVFLLFNGYAEFTYASFLLVFTLIYLLYWLALDGWRKNVRFLGNLMLMGLLFVVGMSPILLRMLRVMLVEGDFLVEGGGFANVFSADLLGFFVPSRLHPLSDLWRKSFDFSYLNFVFVGYSVLGLVIYGAVVRFRDRGVRFWIVAALLFALIALGPTLRINGQERDLPLPFDLLAVLPFFKGNRYPSRYSVMLALCWANLASYGLYRITSLRRGKVWKLGVSAALSGAMLFEHLAVPLPLSDLRVPGVYATIAEEPGDFSVLEIPLAWRNGFRVTGTKDPMIMFSQYYQTKHQKRLLGGNTSRNPEYKFQYFTEAPLFNTIIALENGYEVDREVWDRDRELAPDVLRLLGVRYVVLHKGVVPAVLDEYVQYVFGGELVYEGNGIIAYRVTLAPQGDTQLIDMGTDEARLHLGEGWSESGAGYVWAQRKEARLLASLPGGAQEMSLRVLSPASGQSVEIILNSHPVSSLELLEGWHDYEVQLPASLVREGLNELHLRFGRLFPAEQISDGLYAVGDTGVISPVNILVKSAGEEVGDFGHIYVNGQNVSPGERGYNLAVLDAATGEIEQRGHFDTFASEEESSRLGDFIAGIPDGKIVAVAVEDEASLHLTEDAVKALGTLGAREDLRDLFRWEHAIIGVKDAEPGQALEATGLLRPVSVRVGQGLTEPRAAAAFDYVGFRARR
jgi:hypothetical protein